MCSEVCHGFTVSIPLSRIGSRVFFFSGWNFMCLAILCTARVTGIILFARVSPRRTLHSLREGEYALLPVSCLNGHIVVKPNIPAWRNIVPQQELVALHSPVSLHLLIRNLRLHPSVLLLRSTEVRRTWCWALFRAGRQVSPERMLPLGNSREPQRSL